MLYICITAYNAIAVCKSEAIIEDAMYYCMTKHVAS